MCKHQPHCPAANDLDRDAARVVQSHPEQGWSLLCNGVVAFDDAWDLLPDGKAVAPRSGSWDNSGLSGSVNVARTLSLVG